MKKDIIILALISIGLIAQTAIDSNQNKNVLPQLVMNEIPVAGTVTNTWTLIHSPKAQECFRNGLYQLPGLDYSIQGSTITTAFWIAGDTLNCNYIY